MSTIKVNSIKNTATNDGGIAIDNSGHVQIDGQQLPGAGALSNRNLIINGAMQVAQRSTQETGVSSSGYHTVDRWRFSENGGVVFTHEQSSDAPDGYSNSLRLLCTTGDASPDAGNHYRIQYRIEAQDLQHLFSDKSAGDTHPITLSFWVKASRSGNASFAILQNDNSDRQFTDSYNIGAADTWERKVIYIPADDSAVINNDNGIGFVLEWYLHTGSDWTGGSHATGWEASNNSNRNASNIGIGQAANDEFLITGVQLEVGSVATPFEHKSFGVELARCQRYFYKATGGLLNREYNHGASTNPVFFRYSLPVPLRNHSSATEVAQGDIDDGSDFTTWDYLVSADAIGVQLRKNGVPSTGHCDLNEIEVDNEL